MKRMIAVAAAGVALLAVGSVQSQQQEAKEPAGAVSFKNDVAPVLAKYCMPCHAEESENPSRLSLDTFKQLMEGGKHGSAVVPGKPGESTLFLKLGPKPPFGDPMPLAKRRSSKPPKQLTPEEVKVLSDWIEQGAKDN